MRVALITGSRPPEACGVGDYVHALWRALKSEGVDVEVFCSRDWTIGSVTKLARNLNDPETMVHLQYPTVGYGHSLGPHILSLLRPSIITLHEFAVAHALRRLSVLLFSLRTRQLILTSQFEERKVLGTFPWLAKRTSVIPIGSNIEALTNPPTGYENCIAYFGLVAPGKGIEDFINLADLLSKNSEANGIKTKVIGKIPPAQVRYANRLIEQSTGSNIEWLLDQPAEKVSTLLSSVGVAYLPFPDGASERRGSLKATLAMGVPTLCPFSDMTPADLRNVIIRSDSLNSAYSNALRILRDVELRKRLSQECITYAKAFNWCAIAQSHISLYRQITGSFNHN